MAAPPKSSPPSHEQRAPRAWYLDALTAFAFFLLAFFLTSGAKRALGPIPALFVLTLTGGTAYFFGRSAWRGLTEAMSR